MYPSLYFDIAVSIGTPKCLNVADDLPDTKQASSLYPLHLTSQTQTTLPLSSQLVMMLSWTPHARVHSYDVMLFTMGCPSYMDQSHFYGISIPSTVASVEHSFRMQIMVVQRSEGRWSGIHTHNSIHTP